MHTRDESSPALLYSCPRKLLAALAMVGLADIFFFDRIIGWPAGVFFAMLCGLAALRTPWRSASRLRLAVLAYSLLSAVSVFIMPEFLGVMLCIASLVGYCSLADQDLRRARRWGAAMVLAIPHVVSRPFLDATLATAWGKKSTNQGSHLLRLARTWLPPLGLVVLFLLLFTSANPVLEQWFRYLDIPRLLFQLLNPARVGFWFFLGVFVWMVLRCKRMRFRDPFPQLAAPQVPDAPLSGMGLLRRSLPMLNLLFLLQNGMDAAFLTNGLSLPEGMTYAAYAHRGAYPLLATAILAAAIVLLAMRPGGPAERSRSIRLQTYAWVGQNILLTLTSMFRLSLYVDVYGLTMLRLSAFVWMGLVASGLALIILRIMGRRSGEWLVNANAAMLALTLLVCTFTPMAEVIASHNLAHCREAGGEGVPLDTVYLELLGPQVLPPLETFLEREGLDREFAEKLAFLQLELRHDLCRDLADWRGWTPARARLARDARCPSSVR